MNPEYNFHEDPEAMITALLLGELNDEEAAAVRQAIEVDPGMANLHRRLQTTLDLVQESAATPVGETAAQPEPLKLSSAKRDALLAHFKTVELPQPAKQRRRKISTVIQMAAAVVFVFGVLNLLDKMYVERFSGSLTGGRSLSPSAQVMMDVHDAIRLRMGSDQNYVTQAKSAVGNVQDPLSLQARKAGNPVTATDRLALADGTVQQSSSSSFALSREPGAVFGGRRLRSTAPQTQTITPATPPPANISFSASDNDAGQITALQPGSTPENKISIYTGATDANSALVANLPGPSGQSVDSDGNANATRLYRGLDGIKGQSDGLVAQDVDRDLKKTETLAGNLGDSDLYLSLKAVAPGAADQEDIFYAQARRPARTQSQVQSATPMAATGSGQTVPGGSGFGGGARGPSSGLYPAQGQLPSSLLTLDPGSDSLVYVTTPETKANIAAALAALGNSTDEIGRPPAAAPTFDLKNADSTDIASKLSEASKGVTFAASGIAQNPFYVRQTLASQAQSQMQSSSTMGSGEGLPLVDSGPTNKYAVVGTVRGFYDDNLPQEANGQSLSETDREQNRKLARSLQEAPPQGDFGTARAGTTSLVDPGALARMRARSGEGDQLTEGNYMEPGSTISGYVDSSTIWNPGTDTATGTPSPYSFNIQGKQDGLMRESETKFADPAATGVTNSTVANGTLGVASNDLSKPADIYALPGQTPENLTVGGMDARYARNQWQVGTMPSGSEAVSGRGSRTRSPAPVTSMPEVPFARMGEKTNAPPTSSLSATKADVASAKPMTPLPIPQPETQVRENAFSTFSLNVSDVSFKLAAASLQNGTMPDRASVRSEEFINAFDYRDSEPAPGAPIGFAWERAGYPFAHNRDLLRFSVKTSSLGRQAGRPLNLVLLVDKSGSMERADRVAILRELLHVLAAQLHPEDRLSIVVFARTARLWADSVPGNKVADLADTLAGITPEGGTNLEEAMKLAYEALLHHYMIDGENRVVLLTDGAANLGNVDPEALKKSAESHRAEGVALDCFGVGWEDLNDNLLEALSRAGGGRYGFINTPEEAATEFAGKLTGALRVAASDVKVQVEFNPHRTISYRQIGYAKDQLKKEQFRDNTVKAAQLGAAEAGNGLYTVELNPVGDGPICTVHVRYREPGTENYSEHSWDVPYSGPAPVLDQASAAMRLAATASAFSEWLAGSPYAADVTTDRLQSYLRGVPEFYGVDPRPKLLQTMIQEARSMAGEGSRNRAP